MMLLYAISGFLDAWPLHTESGPRLGGAAVLYPAGGVRALTDGIVTPSLR